MCALPLHELALDDVFEAESADQLAPVYADEEMLPPEPQTDDKAPMTPEQRALAEEYMPLVYGVAHTLHKEGKKWDFEEAVAYGMEALCRATQSYDPTKGISFGAYAKPIVYHRIFDGFRTFDKSRRGVVRSFSLLNGSNTLSLDMPVGKDESATLGEIVPSDAAPVGTELEERVEAEQEWQLLTDALTLLDDREYAIVTQWAHGKKVEDIAKEHSVSGTRVSQILWGSIRMLKNQFGVGVSLTARDSIKVFLHDLPDKTADFDGFTDDVLMQNTGVSSKKLLRRALSDLVAKGIVSRETAYSDCSTDGSPAIQSVRLVERRTKESVRGDLGIAVPDNELDRHFAPRCLPEKALHVGEEIVPHIFTLGSIRSHLRANKALLQANVAVPASQRDTGFVRLLQVRLARYKDAEAIAQERLRQAELRRARLHPTRHYPLSQFSVTVEDPK